MKKTQPAIDASAIRTRVLNIKKATKVTAADLAETLGVNKWVINAAVSEKKVMSSAMLLVLQKKLDKFENKVDANVEKLEKQSPRKAPAVSLIQHVQPAFTEDELDRRELEIISRIRSRMLPAPRGLNGAHTRQG